MTLDKIRTGRGRKLRTEGLQETALPIPYDAAAMPGATVLGTDGKCYQSVKDSQVDSYSWRQVLAYASGGVLLVGGTRTRQISGSNGGYLIQIEKTGNETPIAGLSVLRRIEGSSGPQLTLALDRTDANGNTVPLELDDTLGGLHFAGELNEFGDAPFTRAAIRAKIDEIQSNSARSTALYFFTRISASSFSPLADPDDFTAYPELTPATVITWLEAAIDARAGEEEPTVEQLRSGLAGVLAAKRTPAIVPMPLPW